MAYLLKANFESLKSRYSGSKQQWIFSRVGYRLNIPGDFAIFASLFELNEDDGHAYANWEKSKQPAKGFFMNNCVATL